MSDASERMKRVAELHKEDRSVELARILGMSLKEWAVAYALKERIRLHDDWSNTRSPHALMIDCLYLTGKYTKNKVVTQLSVMRSTKKLWGLCTSPRVHIWRPQFEDVIKEVLSELDTDNVGEVEP